MKRLIILMLMIASITATFAQKAKQAKPKMVHTTKGTAIYTCPMHPEVTSSKPGKCPKCNMDLTLSKKEQMKMEVMKVYTCPMHSDVEANKPGKCPTCGMTLQVKKMETDSSKTKM